MTDKVEFYHKLERPEVCCDDGDHNFSGWREFPDMNGGEQFCSKCGLGAVSYSMRISQ